MLSGEHRKVGDGAPGFLAEIARIVLSRPPPRPDEFALKALAFSEMQRRHCE